MLFCKAGTLQEYEFVDVAIIRLIHPI